MIGPWKYNSMTRTRKTILLPFTKKFITLTDLFASSWFLTPTEHITDFWDLQAFSQKITYSTYIQDASHALPTLAHFKLKPDKAYLFYFLDVSYQYNSIPLADSLEDIRYIFLKYLKTQIYLYRRTSSPRCTNSTTLNLIGFFFCVTKVELQWVGLSIQSIKCPPIHVFLSA